MSDDYNDRSVDVTGIALCTCTPELVILNVGMQLGKCSKEKVGVSSWLTHCLRYLEMGVIQKL